MSETHFVDSNGVPYQVFGDDKRKRKPRPSKYERLLKALLSDATIKASFTFGRYLVFNTGMTDTKVTDKQMAELIAIKESMK